MTTTNELNPYYLEYRKARNWPLDSERFYPHFHYILWINRAHFMYRRLNNAAEQSSADPAYQAAFHSWLTTNKRQVSKRFT